MDELETGVRKLEREGKPSKTELSVRATLTIDFRDATADTEEGVALRQTLGILLGEGEFARVMGEVWTARMRSVEEESGGA